MIVSEILIGIVGEVWWAGDQAMYDTIGTARLRVKWLILTRVMRYYLFIFYFFLLTSPPFKLSSKPSLTL